MLETWRPQGLNRRDRRPALPLYSRHMAEPATLPRLDEGERRVLGVLIEKSLTTPEYYPLTLNALRAACNQRSNRDPVVDYDENRVTESLSRLRHKGLAESVYTDSGRAERFRHLFTTRFTLPLTGVAILCELLLRGDQTPGELNARAGRMARFSGAGEVNSVLHELAEYPEGALVERLPKKPGQKDHRWAHRLAAPDVGHRLAPGAGKPGAAGTAEPAGVLLKKTDDERIKFLEGEIVSLRRELRGLEERFEGIRATLDRLLARQDDET